MGTEYVLNQQRAPEAERERLALVERFHDPPTMQALETIGVAPGWKCLDVGAGAGSVSRWLADRVLPDGELLATDLETKLLTPLVERGVRVLRADITAGPPAVDAFDLVHARLLLLHLPNRATALANMTAAARPGGWVLVGDIDFTTFEALAPWPAWRGAWESLMLAGEQAGWDVACGRRLASLLAAAGLEDVRAEAVQACFAGGETPCEIMARTFERLRDRLLAMDVPAADIDETIAQLRAPTRTFIAPTIWTAWGRRPSA
jgi:SAM-dependent methyltransferase